MNDIDMQEDAWAMQDVLRRLHNLVRIGRVAKVDSERARVRVQVGDLLTDWLPWLVASAGDTRHWRAPSVDEQVVLLSPSGELGGAVVLSALYQEKHPPPTNDPAVEQLSFGDGTLVRYDCAHNTMDIVVAGQGEVRLRCRTLMIRASEHVLMDAPLVKCTGEMKVEKTLRYGGGLEGKGVSVMEGSLAVTGGLSNNGINIGSGHRHRGVRGGTDVSGGPV